MYILSAWIFCGTNYVTIEIVDISVWNKYSDGFSVFQLADRNPSSSTRITDLHIFEMKFYVHVHYNCIRAK